MVATLFVCTVAAVAGFFAWVAHRIGGTRASVVVLAAMAAWLALTGALASTLGVRMVPVAAIATLSLGISPWGRRLVDAVPLRVLVGYQAFRIPVGLALFGLWKAGVVPVAMTFEGRNFDVLTGLSALAIAAARPGPAVVAVWNAMGFALLANIVIISIRSLPENQVPSTFPWVWLPVFLVQAALLGHVLVVRALTQR